MKRLTLCLGLTTLTLAGFAAGRATAGADDGVTLVVRHTVANFDKWKVGYDGHEAERKKYGWTSATVLTDAGRSHPRRRDRKSEVPRAGQGLHQLAFIERDHEEDRRHQPARHRVPQSRRAEGLLA